MDDINGKGTQLQGEQGLVLLELKGQQEQRRADKANQLGNELNGHIVPLTGLISNRRPGSTPACEAAERSAASIWRAGQKRSGREPTSPYW